MENTKSKNSHSGHRKRLRNLIDKAGLKSLSDIQVIEQILTITHSRCDTNEIAHRLIEKFGSISNILDATPEDLMEIKGIGEVTAKTITYLPQIFELYIKDKSSKKYSCKTYKDIYNYFKTVFDFYSEECVLVGYVSKNLTFSSYEKLADGELCEVKLNKIEFSKSIFRHKAKGIVLAHNHPFGKASPSKQDYDANSQIATLLNNLGIILFDNVIIGEDGIFSFKNNCLFENN